MASSSHDTPAMRQFHQFKKQHPECVLFFRMGDFYELFYDDAKIASKTLGLTLTKRANGIPMAGMPYHSVDNYLRRMIQAGHRVAICDQVEDPAQAKGVVKRDVTRLITPGTLTEESMLDEAQPNPLAAVMFSDDDHASVALAELSTGDFMIATMPADVLRDELARLNPSELLYVETANNKPPDRVQQLTQTIGCPLTARPTWQFRLTEATQTLQRQFQVTTLAGYGLTNDDPAIGPAGAVIEYLLETQCNDEGRLSHLRPPRRFNRADHLLIDQTSLRSLEIDRTIRSGEVAGSLLGTLQGCHTAMGKRTLRQWLCYPLLDRNAIEQRQNSVAAIIDDTTFSDALIQQFDRVQDVQRIASRIAMGRPTPRDLVALGQSLEQVDILTDLLTQRPAFAKAHQHLTAIAPTLNNLGQLLREACVESPPAHMRDGGLIRDGYDQLLDEYRNLQRDSNQWLAEYQASLIEKLGIPTLKVGYNKVFGYYIEITHQHTAKAPDEFTRKQTLKNAERYITPELKEYENKVLGASSKAITREQDLFKRLINEATTCLTPLNEFAETIAALDVLACFARRAVRYRYTKPRMVDEPVLHIVEGKHPVLDELLADRYVPNDLFLGTGVGDLQTVNNDEMNGSTCTQNTTATLALITGPNMAGKSTYIRQAALLTLMAHTGSFVPAKEAIIGLTDRIFTRIGASDELHTGQSTFMVEMTETANICLHTTEKSLVILDEIGRGTSTLDGLSLAWAITEHLAARRCRTLFATHYHELVQLSEQIDNIANLNVTVREWADQVVFLHRIVAGAADKSYGIHVAKIAGLPKQVISRARLLMEKLEVHTDNTDTKPFAPPPATAEANQQLGLFTQYIEHPAVSQLQEADLDALTPLAAFDLLRKLKEEL